MEEKNYNSTEEESNFLELSKMLQELPKIKAEDNFEFNLLTKIHNGNFDAKKYIENKMGWSWIYAPATALTLSVILIFFVFNPEIENMDNPLLSNPPLRSVVSSNIPDTMITNSVNIASNLSDTQKSAVSNKTSEKKDSYMVVLQPNDVVVKEKLNYPFEQGVDIDSYVSKNGLRGQSGSQLASYDNYFDFNGFFVRKNISREEMLKEKARLDSLQNAQKTK